MHLQACSHGLWAPSFGTKVRVTRLATGLRCLCDELEVYFKTIYVQTNHFKFQMRHSHVFTTDFSPLPLVATH